MTYLENDITSHEAAAMLGVSRRTVYRWLDEGRIGYPLNRSDILSKQPEKRPRGPARDPNSVRYTRGRHTFRPYKNE
jgi:predicted site-specific integrase-resolvase